MSSCLTSYNKISNNDKLIIIFCFIYDLLNLLPVSDKPKVGRKAKLSTVEILTLIIFRYELKIHDWKNYHSFLKTYHSQDFDLPNYQNFIIQVNNHMISAIYLLNFLTDINKNMQTIPVSAADSSDLPVCANKRIFEHKVCKGSAQRGKTSKGWFYGFKIHIIVDMHGNLQSIRIAPAGIDERKVIKTMINRLRCLILLADAGYVSAKLTYYFYRLGIWYLTCVRNNMKKLITFWQHALLKKRQIAEVVFSTLKYRLGLVSSLPRSPRGHLARYIHTCLAYQIIKFLKNNNNQQYAYLLTK